MFSKIIRIIILVISLLLLLNTGVWASEITGLDQLIENATKLDGQEVTVSGEAIGEILSRGDHAWVNINGGSNSMGIWMSLDDAMKINFMGDYKHSGDQLLITGIFNQACSVHGGDVDIHCKTMQIVSIGEVIEHQVSLKRIATAVAFSILAIILGLIYWRTCRRKKNWP